jgi:hypothetical protein
MKLITHPYLLLRCRISEAVCLPNLCAFMAYTGTNVPLPVPFSTRKGTDIWIKYSTNPARSWIWLIARQAYIVDVLVWLLLRHCVSYICSCHCSWTPGQQYLCGLCTRKVCKKILLDFTNLSICLSSQSKPRFSEKTFVKIYIMGFYYNLLICSSFV